MIKKRKSFAMLLAMAAALSMTGCSDEVITEGGGNKTEVSGDYVHVSAAVALPSGGTRSGTEDDPAGSGSDLTNSDQDKNKDGNASGENDYEYGYDYENDVRSMLLVIADKDDKYITHTVVNGITEVPSGQKFDFMATGEIKHEALAAAYASDGLLGSSQDKKVNIYAYCNYTGRLLDLFEGKVLDDNETAIKPEGTNWLNWAGQVVEEASPVGHTPAISNTIWASRSFLMTNAHKFEAKFPDDLDDWDDYTEKTNPYPVGEDGKSVSPIKVERAAARIDFRDGSKGENGKTNDNTYPLTITTTREKSEDQAGTDNQGGTQQADAPVSTAEELNLFNVKLTRMALVNMSKDFYYLRRVSDDGQNVDASGNLKAQIGGTETSATGKTPYVVDVDADKKLKPNTNEGITVGTVADSHFNFPLFEKETKEDGTEVTVYAKKKWYADKIDDVLKGKDDTWGTTSQYKIWRYVTENTIPKAEKPDTTSNQQTIQSTGVVFKASILAGEDIDAEYTENSGTTDETKRDFRYVSKEVKAALNNVKTNQDKSPILYSYSNMLYAGIDDLVRAAVMEGQGSPLYLYVDRILGNWGVNYDKDKGPEATDQFEYQATKQSDKEFEKLTVAIYYDMIGGGDGYDPKTDDASEPAGTRAGDDDDETPETTDGDQKSPFAVCGVDFKTKADGTETINEENIVKEAPKNSIAVYEATNEGDGEDWGYYCYYFYWNRHNDNGKSGKMGPMEFATVRNNVYKLAVTKVGQLGHPTIPSNDPDPVKPDDPDENPTEYIQVQVEVLPWVVRVNDIEF